VAQLSDLPTQPSGTQALIDLLLVACESPPRQPERIDEPSRYAATVSDQLELWYPPERRRLAVAALVDGLVSPPPQPCGLAVVSALATVIGERPALKGLIDDILRVLVPAVEKVPDTIRYLPDALQYQVLTKSPPLRSRELLERLADAVQGAAGEETVVELWAEGCWLRCPPDDVLARLSDWPPARSPERLFAVIDGLLRRLVDQQHDDIVTAIAGAHRAVLTGELGNDLAREYGQLLVVGERALQLQSQAVTAALSHGREPRRVRPLRWLKSRRLRR
jgi:hypothetical protein